MRMRDEAPSTWFDWAAKHLNDWAESQGLFATEAVEAIQNAAQAAHSLNHECVGAEHLLAGLLKLNHGSAPKLLRASGIDLVSLRREIETTRGKVSGQKTTSLKSYSARFKRILESARAEAEKYRDAQVDTGHLLLGLLRERGSLAVSILEKFHVNPEQLRLAVLKDKNRI